MMQLHPLVCALTGASNILAPDPLLAGVHKNQVTLSKVSWGFTVRSLDSDSDHPRKSQDVWLNPGVHVSGLGILSC